MEIISIILNFVLSTGIVGVLIFYSSKRRQAEAEAASAESEVKVQEFSIQKVNIEFLSSQLQEAWTEVEKMQQIINSKREQIIELIKQTKQLEIELIESQNARHKAEIYTCFKSECSHRSAS